VIVLVVAWTRAPSRSELAGVAVLLADPQALACAIGYTLLLNPAWVFLRLTVRGVWGSDAAPHLGGGAKYGPASTGRSSGCAARGSCDWMAAGSCSWMGSRVATFAGSETQWLSAVRGNAARCLLSLYPLANFCISSAGVAAVIGLYSMLG
jgi:hypothetical protein